jgi:sugar lactone lactonase YvrE
VKQRARHGGQYEVAEGDEKVEHLSAQQSPVKTWLARRSGMLGGILLGILTLAAAPAAACTGDCDGNDEIAVNELLLGINIGLGSAQMNACPVFDTSADGEVTVDELLASVKAAVLGCPAPIISTIAGTGIAGINEEGLPPLESHLYLPQDTTPAPDGSLILVDWNNHRMRRIRDGFVETIAGTGELGAADDGDALYTQFNHPTNVCFDADGNLLIAAWHNSLVKKLSFLPDGSPGRAVTIAGTGARAFGGDEGPGVMARLDLPSSVVVDTNGNVIISDQANFRLRLLEPSGTIHTIAGTGMPGGAGDEGPAVDAQLNGPRGQSAAPASRIDIDSRNRIFIADTGNHKIRMIDEVGVIHTVVGTGTPGYEGDGGPALSAQLNTPSDIAVAPNGTLYIADTQNNAIRVVRPNGNIFTYAGTGERGFSGDGGPARNAQLDRPYGVSLAPNGTLYVADTHNQRIRQVTDANVTPPPTPIPTPPPTIIPCTDEVGSICTYAGTGARGFDGDGANRLESALYWPFDMEFLANGRRIVLDWNNHRVREILSDDTFVTIMGTDFVGDGPKDLSDLTPAGADPLTVDLNHPTDIAMFSNGDVLIAAWHNHKLRQINASDGRVRVLLGAGAAFAGDGGPAKDARVNQPPRFVLDPDGNLFLIDQRNQRIRVIYDFDTARETAIVGTILGTGERGFNGNPNALQTTVNLPTGGNPEPSGGIALDVDGTLYFADTNNNCVRKVEFADPGTFLQGTVSTVAGQCGQPAGFGGDNGPAVEAALAFPQDIEILDGDLYVADCNNNRVRVVDLDTGIITTIAGTGEKAYGGDGGPATAAKLNRPFGLAFDDNGDLYISDTFNSRIRKLKR